MRDFTQSPHFRDGKFRNRSDWPQPSIGQYVKIMYKFLTSRDGRTPKQAYPTRAVDLTLFNNKAEGQLNVTWLGHSSLMINIDGYRILTDPVFQTRLTPWGPSRYNGEVPLDIARVPEFDVILISHNHYDHLNKFSIKQLHGRARKLVMPLAVSPLLQKWGVPQEKIVELDWWEEARYDENLRFIAAPSQHFSGRGITDRDKTQWCSFVIQTYLHNIYFGGDSGYFAGFREIGGEYGPFDMTFVETGAYNENWDFIHMFPEQTVQAHLDLQGRILHPIHWATFNLAMHPWYEPMQRLTAEAERKGVIAATPQVGETTIHGSHIPTQKWWEGMI